VETLLVEDLFMPLQKRIEIEGDGYVLIGGKHPWSGSLVTADKCGSTEKKEWVYGQGLVLMGGDEAVRAAANKWVFHFRLCRKKKTQPRRQRDLLTTTAHSSRNYSKNEKY
jgi:hypothetical protein